MCAKETHAGLNMVYACKQDHCGNRGKNPNMHGY